MGTCPTRVRWTVCRLCKSMHDCSETEDGWECWRCHIGPEGGYPTRGRPDRRVPYSESNHYGRDTLW